MSHDLEHYRLKSMDHGQLTGVSIAVHAIPDAFLLMHSGVGCKHKATTQLSTHDWAQGAVSREAWTEVGDAALIEGSAGRIGPYVRTWQARMNPALMVIVSVTFLDLTGDDYSDVVRQLNAELPCEVVYVRAPGFEGDLWQGYLSTVLEVVKRIDWSIPQDRPDEVTLLGYLWDRYEGDHTGNLQHLKAILQSVGLNLGATLLSGVGLAGLGESARAGIVASLPYAAPKAKHLAKASKRTLVPVDLPIGLRGTAAFLRAITQGRPQAARAELFIAKQEQSFRERAGQLIDRLRGQRVAIFADLPLAVGLASLLDEFGMIPQVIGLRGHSLGGAAAFRDGLARIGARLPDVCEVLEHPSLGLVRDSVASRLRKRSLDGVIGSATDLNAISTIPASEILRPYAGEQMFPMGPFRIEMGFPCREHHCAYPMPYMGYAGLMLWVQRFLSAPRFFDSGRRSSI